MSTAATSDSAAGLPDLAGYPSFLRPRVVASGAYYAGFWIRVAAGMVDAAILAVLYLVVQYVLQAVASLISAFAHFAADSAIVWTSVLSLILVVGYYDLVLVARSAATPGMRSFAMRIVDDTDVTVTPARRTLYVRGLLWVLFTLTGVLAIVDALVVVGHARKRSLHDIIAGTAVVRRAPRARTMPSLLCSVCGEPVDEGSLCPRHGGSRGLSLTLTGRTVSVQTAGSLLAVFAAGAFITGIVLVVTGRLLGLAAVVLAALVIRVAMSLTQLKEWARWATFIIGLAILVGAGVLGAGQLSTSVNTAGVLFVGAALGALISACAWTPETYREFHRTA